MVRPSKILPIQKSLLSWYRRNRRDLPWRRTRDPYAILVSEVMLQQTQVDRVIPKYQAWLQRWPTIKKLAAASSRDVLHAWSGLGYNRRALYLKRAAEIVTRDFGGQLPSDPAVLQTLPGLGRYTSRAVAVFAFQQPVSMIDTNVRRVLQRLFFWPRTAKEKTLESVADASVPPRTPGAWHHALMDLGATICVSGRPRCEICPLQKYCQAYPKILQAKRVRKSGGQSFTDSNRFWRGRIVARLLEQRQSSAAQLYVFLQTLGSISRPRMLSILKALERDHLVQHVGQAWKLPT